MAIIKTKIFGRSLVGAFLTANNSFILYPTTLLKPLLKKFKTIFEEPFYPLTINNSNLLGIYSASNKYGIIVPHIIREDELNNLLGELNPRYFEETHTPVEAKERIYTLDINVGSKFDFFSVF